MKKDFASVIVLRSIFFKTLLVLSIAIFSNGAYSQSHIAKLSVHDHTGKNSYSRHTIESFEPLRPDDYNRAVEEQIGVIGGDFYNKQNVKSPLGRNGVWSPINGFKETMCGELLSYYKRTPFRVASEDAEERDDDIHFLLVPSLGGTGLYNQSYINKNRSEREISPEIDIADDIYIGKMRKYTPNVPKQEIDYVAVYGPWVLDEGHNNLEIHPTEQVWWANRKGTTDNYHIYSFLDASHRLPLAEWTGIPFTTIVGVAIRGKLHGPVIKVQIEEIGKKNVSFASTDEKRHYLIYKRDTLAIVNENTTSDILDIKFEKVGLDPFALLNNITDSVFTGFVVIQSKLDPNGALLLSCDVTDQKNTGYLSRIQDKYRVTLEKLVCDGVDDFDDDEDIFGYIGVQATSPSLLPIGNTILSANNNSSLLWFRRDGNAIHLKKNQSISVNSYLDFNLESSSSIVIKADLNEDDTNTDYNESVADDDRWYQTDVHADDNLADGSNVKMNRIQVSELKVNSPKQIVLPFSSGGSKIRAILKVERLTNNTKTVPRTN